MDKVYHKVFDAYANNLHLMAESFTGPVRAVMKEGAERIDALNKQIAELTPTPIEKEKV